MTDTKPKTMTVKLDGNTTLKLRRATIADRITNAHIYRALGMPTADDGDSFYAKRVFVSVLLLTEAVKGDGLGFDLPKPSAGPEVQRAAFAAFLALDASVLDAIEPALIELGAWSES